MAALYTSLAALASTTGFARQTMIHGPFTMSSYHGSMFEGHINKKTLEDARESTGLHQFRWTELVAKLSATRELREELARGEPGGFEAFGDVRRENGEESKRAVNQTGLAHGKDEALGRGRAATGAVQGDREK